MSLIDNLNWRYATKRMNGTKVSDQNIEYILEAIRLTPTSFGFQPFKVFVIENPVLREEIFNNACQQPQIKEASHILVFAATKNVTTEQVDDYIQSIATTRAIPAESLSGFKSKFGGIIAGNEDQNFKWTSRQTYIALGVALMAAAEKQVDSTPMEGFSAEALDKILGLNELNLSSVSILTLGYRNEETDHLAKATKVRKTKNELFILN